MDVKDILGVPRGGHEKADAPKPKPEKLQRPAGMSREAFALLDGAHPVIPAVFTSDLKKGELKAKRKAASKERVAPWRWRPFTNPARGDGLQLGHWTKCKRTADGGVVEADQGPYRYAQYNKQVFVYRYDEEEWQTVVPRDASWSRAETDYLLGLCQRYDLRFVVIADRYEFPGGPPRDLEALKERYYGVARALLLAREGAEEGAAHQPLVKQPYSAEAERERKRAVAAVLRRTAADDAADARVLEAARGIEAARRAEAAARRPPAPPPQPKTEPGAAAAAPGPQPLPRAEPGAPSLYGPDGRPVRPRAPGVYSRAAFTRDAAAQQLANVPGGTRVQKLVDQMLRDIGAAEPPAVPTAAACAAWLAWRAEAIALYETKRHLQLRVASAGEAGLESASRGKRAKTKAPQRYEDA